MKIRILITILYMVTSTSLAQISVETLAGNKQVHHLNYWQKDIDTAGRFNFFFLSRFAVDYKDKMNNNFSSEGQLSIRIKDWLGIAVGGGFDGLEFVPTIGLNLSYLNKKEDFFIEVYPTIGITNSITPSLFGLVGYNPKFNPNWGISTQLIFSLDEIQASQLISLGINYKDKLQFGIGADLYQFKERQFNFASFGPFFRLNL